MRILLVIPHAFIADAAGERLYGAERSGAEIRGAALLRCVSALHQSFGPRHHLVGAGHDLRCNASLTATLDIVLCTAAAQHLAHAVPSHLVHHRPTTLHPRLLGFAAQAILRDNAARFDWFGYVEDDCEVTDPLLFAKLAWFNALFGERAFLQPNRYEISSGPVVQKLYIDGRLASGQDARVDRPAAAQLEATALGRIWRFRHVSNPHSGCFFADAAQMARLAADTAFGHYSEAFIGPLESAATLPILRNFAVYKPARENAGFLEVRHLDQRLLDRRLSFSFDAAGEVVRTVAPDG